MKSWIAHEHDDTGWPTGACLVVTARTQTEAKQLMSSAISVQCQAAAREDRERLYAIFIEAPQELPIDDPRHDLIDPAAPTFLGFDPGRPESKS